MTFKFIVSRPPFAVEFETGSISEGIGVFQNEESEFAKLFDLRLGSSQDTTAVATGTVQQPDVATEPANRRRKPRNVEAVAPDPIAIPGAEAPPTAPAAPDLAIPADGSVPAFLDRTAAAAPPPPPAPPAPPAPPSAPPTGVLAAKVIAECDRRAAGREDGGQALADWLAGIGITIKGATYTEAMDVLRLQGDEKLGPVAAQLGVA